MAGLSLPENTWSSSSRSPLSPPWSSNLSLLSQFLINSPHHASLSLDAKLCRFPICKQLILVFPLTNLFDINLIAEQPQRTQRGWGDFLSSPCLWFGGLISIYYEMIHTRGWRIIQHIWIPSSSWSPWKVSRECLPTRTRTQSSSKRPEEGLDLRHWICAVIQLCHQDEKVNRLRGCWQAHTGLGLVTTVNTEQSWLQMFSCFQIKTKTCVS